MKYVLYCNNLPFTYRTVINGLDMFWKNNILEHKNKKIWLTIDLNFSDQSRFKLINKLPFNSSEYSDLLVVAGDKLKSNLLYSQADLLDSITFTYYVKKRQNNASLYTYKYSLLLFILSCAFISILSLFILWCLCPCTVEITEEVLVPNKVSKSPFTLFIDLFKADSYHMYSPSYFLPSNIVIDITDCGSKNPARSFIVECVRNKQYETLIYLTEITIEHINTMKSIAEEYSRNISDIYN